jgi:phosphatidylcholine synthase
MRSDTDTISRKALAYAVHLFTACGAVCGVLSLLAIMRGDWRMCMIWNVVAMVIDGLDGTLARRARVKEVLPEFDGALLDNIVDYLNYVVVPALLIYATGVLPEISGVFAAACMVLSSAYQFCQNDAKTADNYFKGFPSYWNVVAFYLIVLDVNAWIKLSIVILLTIFVFVPIKYLYPSRTARFRTLTLVLTFAWSAAIVWMIAYYPSANPVCVWGSLVYVAYYVGASVICTFEKGPRRIER